jgi:hypothetical protein
VGRPRLSPEGRAKQHRIGQIPWRNTQGHAVLEAVPADRFVDTMTVYMDAAEKAQIEWKQVQQWLCYLANRGLIERKPKPNCGSLRTRIQRRIVAPEQRV